MAAAVKETTVAELLASTADPFVRHHVDPALVRAVWTLGDAVVVSGGRGRPGEVTPGPVFTCVGPAADLVPLMAAVATSEPPPWRVTNSIAVDAQVPAGWARPGVHGWHWMLTETCPDESAAADTVVVTDADEIDAVLDVSLADSFARPGAPGIETWVGVRREGRLLGVGALMRLPRGAGHLRGIGVLPEARGRGIGTAISAALTRRGIATGPGVCTLGVYTDNPTAIAMYERLGYRTVHTFTSGQVVPAPGP